MKCVSVAAVLFALQYLQVDFGYLASSSSTRLYVLCAHFLAGRNGQVAGWSSANCSIIMGPKRRNDVLTFFLVLIFLMCQLQNLLRFLSEYGV